MRKRTIARYVFHISNLKDAGTCRTTVTVTAILWLALQWTEIESPPPIQRLFAMALR